MKLMSFMLTTEQVRNSTPEHPLKDVTRRLGWWKLEPGQRVMACEKCMGLRKGEAVQRIREIEIVRVGGEPLNTITQEDVKREGFPDMTPAEFVAFFAKSHRCAYDAVVNRIEFRYLP